MRIFSLEALAGEGSVRTFCSPSQLLRYECDSDCDRMTSPSTELFIRNMSDNQYLEKISDNQYLEKISDNQYRFFQVQNTRFEVGHFDASQEASLKEEYKRESAQDLDQKIASVKKVWEDPVPQSMTEHEQAMFSESKNQSLVPGYESKNQSLVPGYESKNQSLVPGYESKNQSLVPGYESKNQSLVPGYESKSPPRQSVVNPSLAPGYKSIQPKQVAVAYPMTSSANMTPSPPVLQPSQINSPPLDPLRHSFMGYPTHVSTPPGGHLYNTPAANFYQQFGQHMYPFSAHQNPMTHAFSNVLNQGFPNMITPNHYQNPVQNPVQYQMQQMKTAEGGGNPMYQMQQMKTAEGGGNPMYQMQQMKTAEVGGNPMANSLSQNSYFQHQNHSFYQQPAATMHQQQPAASMHQQQSYGVGHQSGQQYRQPQPVSMPRNPSLDTSNGSSNVMRMNNQIPSGNTLYNTTSAEVFQKLFLQHQAMSQAATAIVGRGRGNAKVSQTPSGQVGNQYNAQQNFQQQRPMQMQRSTMPSPSSAGVPHQQSMAGMNTNQMPSSSFPQPIQRPTPAGPSVGMTAQYSQKGPGSKMSNRAVSGQNVSIDAAKQREDAIRSTEFFFASTRDPSTVDGKSSSEPTSLE